ncbi:MAG: 30S ribosomal protein S4 [Patescibacteria group bacterium]
MGRYTGPRNKIARRFGVNLGLKSNPTKVAKRLSQKPGVHGASRRPKSTSSFGKQLEEKQKAKYIYGIREKQIRRYVNEATKTNGDSGIFLQQILEMRLDNVIYRLGFAITRAQARQMTTHGMFMVNGKKLDVPSHIVAVGDEITVKPNKNGKKIFDSLEDRAKNYELPSWLQFNAATKTGKVISKPMKEDFEQVFDVKFIIEYFSTR